MTNHSLRRHVLASALAIACFAALFAVAFRNAPAPQLPNPLRLQARFERGEKNRSDPIVCTGVPQKADFLFVRCVDSGTIIFGYDSWNARGVASQPLSVDTSKTHSLVIEMPGLTHVVGETTSASNRLHVEFDGAVVLDTKVEFYPRPADDVYIGVNPIGGTACGPLLHGELSLPGGRAMSGRIPTLVSAWALPWLRLRVDGLHLWPIAVLALVLGWSAQPLIRWAGRRSLSDLRPHLVFIAVAAPCLLAFAYVVTDEHFDFGYEESFGSFYDYQANSLLNGRLDVVPEAVSSEAFIVKGKSYGYFGLTPALWRIPLVTLDLDHRTLSRTAMLVNYAACLFFSYLILLQAARRIRPEGATLSGWVIGLFTLNVGMGSTLFFLASRAYTYHEAIITGVALGLATVYCSLRAVAGGGGPWYAASWVCALFCTHARPSTGLFAFSFVACSALYTALPAFRARLKKTGTFPWRPVILTGLCIAGVFSFNGVSYLKFGTFEAVPLRYSVLQYSAYRLAKIGGKNFHAGNIRTNLDGYLYGINFKLRPRFPFFFNRSFPKTRYPEAKMDLIEQIVGFPFALTGLFSLAVAGAVLAFRRGSPLRDPLVVLGVAATPFVLAMLAAIALSQRYTADFLPILIPGAAFGFCGLESARKAGLFRVIAAFLTVWSIFVTLALTARYQGEQVWGVPDQVTEHYHSLANRVDMLLHLPPHDPP